MMKNQSKHLLLSIAAAFLTLTTGAPAMADDTELFVGDSGSQEGAYPNLLFILDNSGSMGDPPSGNSMTSQSYDPDTTYDGECDADKLYYLTSGNRGVGGGRGNLPDPPTCDSQVFFTSSAMTCDDATAALKNTGFFTDRLAQWDSTGRQWRELNTGTPDWKVECRADGGNHGETAGTWYAANGNNGPWSSNRQDEINWNRNYNTSTIYTANYLNYYWSIGVLQNRTKLEIVQSAAIDLINSMNNVNVGLINFDPQAGEEGGDVISAMGNISVVRNNIIQQITAMSAQTFTPLSETLYEAGQYYAGKTPDYGNSQRLSVQNARVGNGTKDDYKTPIEYECQNNFTILLTDGLPTRDSSADTEIAALKGGTCDPALDANGNRMSDQNGHCLDDMAQYMYENDLNPDLDGVQNVVTYTIGFDIDFPLIYDTAKKGGGDFYPANDAKSLANVLTAIVRNILNTQTSFVAPTVSVNAFNRTQTRDDLYVAVFSPTNREAWPGNIKKYRLVNGQIVGQDMSTPVVDPSTGFLKPNSQSFWSSAPDGDNVRNGGAANEIPDPASRNVLTTTAVGSTSLSQVNTGNTALVTQLQTYPGVANQTEAESVVAFMRGVDVRDENQNGNRTEPRYWLGDPLHARPEMVTYGGTVANPDNEDNVLYAAANDGVLHAINPNTGAEKWAFIPFEMLALQPALYWDDVVVNRDYGIDGNVRSMVVDLNGDGIVDPSSGERVYLFFGLRRGGDTYYGLDVTYKDSPRLMWTLNGGDLPGLGETWSTPTPIRVKIGDGTGQNARNLALVFGGGYDNRQDNGPYAADAKGAGIYIIDALSGNLLWRAAASGANFNSADMTNAIVSDIRALDMTNDGLVDRMYASDLGGRVWRFDITNGLATNQLVAGGVIASLGGAADGTTATENRRFYYAPDTALVTTRFGRYMHIGLGSGYRAHPLDKELRDRFYAIRDYNPFRKLTQDEYNAITPLTDTSLQDVTNDVTPNLAPNANGWKIELNQGGWIGEKVLSESRTFADTIYFTSFTPGANTNPCQPGQGLNKLYAVSVIDGRPVNNLDGVGSDTELSIEDRVQSLAMGGIAPEIVFLFPDPTSCTSGDCQTVYGFVGLEGIGNLGLPPYVRTYWEQAGSE